MKRFLSKLQKTFYNPRGLTCLLLFPINLLVPLVITSLAWGFPMPYYLNSIYLKSYNQAFNTIAFPENVEVVSKNYYFTSNILDNLKREEEIKKAQLESGETIVPRDDEERIYNGCDYFAGRLITSTTPQEELSQQFIDAYAVAVEASIDAGKYKYFVGSHLRLVPVNRQSLTMQIEHKPVDLTKKFNIKAQDITDGETYLVYMLYDNFNEYSEPRCN